MIKLQKGQTGYEVREIYDDETGTLRMRQIYLNGEPHSPPSDEPSHSAYDEQGRPLLFEWHKEGLDHRENGPSSILFNPENGVHKVEVYEIEGKPRLCVNGPHIVRRDKDTGKIYETSTDQDWRQRNSILSGTSGPSMKP